MNESGDRGRTLDEVAAGATPAPVARVVNGWRAKAAPDLPFRRANAVLPALGAGADRGRAAAVLDELEAWYGGMGQRLLVQVSSADPTAPALDALLAERGFAVEAPVDVLVAPAADLAPAIGSDDIAVAVTTGVDAAWAERYGAVHGDDAPARARVEAYGRMLAGLGPAALGAAATRAGALAGIGFGVVEQGRLGVFGMGTAPAHRRRGVARAVLVALAATGARAGAADVYLQAEVDNAAGQVLYRGLGFTRSHGYHYRVSAPASTPAG